MFPASPVCSACMSEEMEAVALSAKGNIYAFSEIHVGPKKWKKPYILGYVDLEEGVRILAHIVGDTPTIGGSVYLDTALVGVTEAGDPMSSFVFRVETGA